MKIEEFHVTNCRPSWFRRFLCTIFGHSWGTKQYFSDLTSDLTIEFCGRCQLRRNTRSKLTPEPRPYRLPHRIPPSLKEFHHHLKKIMMFTKEQIIQLLPGQRIAGFLSRSAKLAELGAFLRANDRADETWTEQEIKEWNDLCSEFEVWRYSLRENEYEIIEEVDEFLASICRGEYPPEINERKTSGK